MTRWVHCRPSGHSDLTAGGLGDASLVTGRAIQPSARPNRHHGGDGRNRDGIQWESTARADVMTAEAADGPVFPDVPMLADLDGQLPTDRVVKDYIFAHYEIGEEFTLSDIVTDTGTTDAEAVNGILNAWWWDADTGNPLLMVEMIGESPDRFCFVKAPGHWLPGDDYE